MFILSLNNSIVSVINFLDYKANVLQRTQPQKLRSQIHLFLSGTARNNKKGSEAQLNIQRFCLSENNIIAWLPRFFPINLKNFKLENASRGRQFIHFLNLLWMLC